MLDWMLMPYRRYAEFSGRSQRKEYWMFVLLQLIVFAIGGLLIVMGGGMTDPSTGTSSLGVLGYLGIGIIGLFVLGSFVPGIAVQVRRLHDQDKSGWLWFLSLVPYVGGIIMLVFMCIEGTKGDNRYGPDPKGAENLGDVFR